MVFYNKFIQKLAVFLVSYKSYHCERQHSTIFYEFYLLNWASCPLNKKIPHLAAGDFYYLSTKLAAELTELTSSRSNQECGVSYDVANSEVS